MLLEASSSCTDAESVIRERFDAFMLSRGYRTDGTAMVRGSRLGTFTSLNPRKWAVRVTLEPRAPMRHFLRFDVNTSGQMTITPSERGFWERELEATVNVLDGKSAGDLDAAEAAATSSSKFLLLHVFGFLAVFAAVELVGAFKGFRLPPGFSAIGAGIGFAVGYHRWKHVGTT
jgi:hypothetical protein